MEWSGILRTSGLRALRASQGDLQASDITFPMPQELEIFRNQKHTLKAKAQHHKRVSETAGRKALLKLQLTRNCPRRVDVGSRRPKR